MFLAGGLGATRSGLDRETSSTPSVADSRTKGLGCFVANRQSFAENLEKYIHSLLTQDHIPTVEDMDS